MELESPGAERTCKEKSSHFGHPWLAWLMVILASGHGSDNVHVSCGGTVGSSCGWARYLRDW